MLRKFGGSFGSLERLVLLFKRIITEGKMFGIECLPSQAAFNLKEVSNE